MNKEEFCKAIELLNIKYDKNMLEKLELLTKELINYNEKTNLTRIINVPDVYLKHYYDSLTISKVIDLSNFNNLIDVGTGAGFPGLLLKIFYPNLSVTLLDSNNKKTTWLEYISKKLELDVTVINKRIEDYSKYNLNSFDVVTSRAVANLRVLSEICLPLVKTDGLFIPLKGKIEDELSESMGTLSSFNAEIIKDEAFKLFKNEGTRNILVIKKNKKTNADKIRTYDKILKKPLK